MAHYYIGNNYNSTAENYSLLKEAFSNYSQLDIEYDDVGYSCKIFFQDMPYYLKFSWKTSTFRYIYMDLYNDTDERIKTYDASSYTGTPLYISLLELQGKGMFFGLSDNNTSYACMMLAFIDSENPTIVSWNYDQDRSACIYKANKHYFYQSMNKEKLYISADSIQFNTIYDSLENEFIDGLWVTTIDKGLATDKDILLVSVDTRRFYLWNASESLNNTGVRLVLECTDKYTAIPSPEPSEGGDVVIQPIVLDGVEIARINNVSLYCPEVEVNQVLSTGTRIAKINNTNIYAPSTDVQQVVSTGTVVAKVNDVNIYTPNVSVEQVVTQGTTIARVNGTNIIAPNSGGDTASMDMTPVEKEIGQIGMLCGTESDSDYPVSNQVTNLDLYEVSFMGVPMAVVPREDGDTVTYTYGDISYTVTYYVEDGIITSFSIEFVVSDEVENIYPRWFEGMAFGNNDDWHDYMSHPLYLVVSDLKIYESSYGFTIDGTFKDNIDVPYFMCFTIRYTKTSVYDEE